MLRTARIATQRKMNLDAVWAEICNGTISPQTMAKIWTRYEIYKDDLGIQTTTEFIAWLGGARERIYGLEKDPIRQSLDEKLQTELYTQRTGKVIRRIYNGLYINKETLTIESKRGVDVERTKAFDGVDDNGTFYICKYVGESGGAQDNQIRDVADFFKYCSLYNNQERGQQKFTFILSGAYMVRHLSHFEKYRSDLIEIVVLE